MLFDERRRHVVGGFEPAAPAATKETQWNGWRLSIKRSVQPRCRRVRGVGLFSLWCGCLCTSRRRGVAKLSAAAASSQKVYLSQTQRSSIMMGPAVRAWTGTGPAALAQDRLQASALARYSEVSPPETTRAIRGRFAAGRCDVIRTCILMRRLFVFLTVYGVVRQDREALSTLIASTANFAEPARPSGEENEPG